MSALGLRAAEPLADARARRPRAGDALGPGLAAGDRPRPVRAPAGQARRDRRPRPRRSRRWSTRRWAWPLRPHCGPAFLDFPLDVVFMEAEEPEPARAAAARRAAARRSACSTRAVALLRDAERPVIMAGTNLYWGRGEEALRALAEARGHPGLPQRPRARLRAGRPPAVLLARARRRRSRAPTSRSSIGVPMDFRLGFGQAFGPDMRADRARRRRARARPPAAGRRRALRRPAPARCARSPAAVAGAAGTARLDRAPARRSRTRSARPSGAARRPARPAAPAADLRGARRGARPRRDRHLRRRRLRLLRRAARSTPTSRAAGSIPGRSAASAAGPGYALAAKLARPDRQVVLLLGDGAFGFAGMEWDTLARHGVGVVGVMGNNGIWGLEKHPMEFLYGYSVVADLRPETRYDQVVEALGARRRARARRRRELRPALERALRRRRAGARQRAHRSVRGLPALGQPGVAPEAKPPAAGRGGSKLAPSGRAGVRALGALLDPDGGRRRLMRHIARTYASGDDGGRHVRPTDPPSIPPVNGAIVRTSRCARRRTPAQAPRELQRDAPEDVALRDLDGGRARTRRAPRAG